MWPKLVEYNFLQKSGKSILISYLFEFKLTIVFELQTWNKLRMEKVRKDLEREREWHSFVSRIKLVNVLEGE